MIAKGHAVARQIPQHRRVCLRDKFRPHPIPHDQHHMLGLAAVRFRSGVDVREESERQRERESRGRDSNDARQREHGDR